MEFRSNCPGIFPKQQCRFISNPMARRFAMAADPVIRFPELNLETEKKTSETTVRGTGRITSETSAELENTLRKLIPEGKRIVLDLTGIEYIDSSGLGALVSIYTHAKRANCDLEIANPRQRIRDL